MKAIRLGAAGALTALSLATVTPAQAATTDPCGIPVDSVKICTARDGSTYPVLVSAATAGPRPGIGGALMVGSTLTAYDGAWEPKDATLTHQWLRNDVPILGAVGRTYRLSSKDVGKGIRVATTATAPGYKTTTVRSVKTAPVTLAGALPKVKAPATVSFGWAGNNDDGPSSVVAAQPGFWPTPGVQFHYQWLRDGASIPGANGANFDKAGWGPEAKLSVRITGYAPGLEPAAVTSGSQVIRPYDPIPGAVVTGGTGPGDVLTGVDDVPWSDFDGRGQAGYPHSYRWLRNGVPIPGADKLTYTITAEDQGSTLVLHTITETFVAYSNAVVVPAAAGAEPKQLANVTKPVLTGDAVTGVRMSVTAGTWSLPLEKLTITYDWFSDKGQIWTHDPAFAPGSQHLGGTISVLVTATAPGYAPARVKITAAKPVAAPDPAQVKAPVVQGTPGVGKGLSVAAGKWSSDVVIVNETFQWLRAGSPIAGATGRNYTPAGADYGKQLSVKVTASRDGRTLLTQKIYAPGKVAAGTLKVSVPTVAGTAKFGTLLTASHGTWTKGTSFKYRWLRNGAPISDATGSTYKVRSADKNARITVRVTGSLLGYATAYRESAALLAR